MRRFTPSEIEKIRELVARDLMVNDIAAERKLLV
jgi:hypothetical protein